MYNILELSRILIPAYFLLLIFFKCSSLLHLGIVGEICGPADRGQIFNSSIDPCSSRAILEQ